MKYQRVRFIIVKCIIFNRGIRSLFESYRQDFGSFDFIIFNFSKIQLVFELFLLNRDSNEVCN